jgi:hypothetical protein
MSKPAACIIDGKVYIFQLVSMRRPGGAGPAAAKTPAAPPGCEGIFNHPLELDWSFVP